MNDDTENTENQYGQEDPMFRKLRSWFRVAGREPELPMNDAWVLYWWTTIAELLLLPLAHFAAVRSGFIVTGGYELLVWLFLTAHLLASAYGAVYYPDKERIAQAREAQDKARLRVQTGTKRLFRRGEVWNALFTGATAILIPVLYVSGAYEMLPPYIFDMGAASVAILATFSMIKMIRLPSRRRAPHNEALFWLSVIMSAAATLMLVGEAWLGWRAIPTGAVFLYVAIIGSYAMHNTAFSLLCPNCKTARPGHLVGWYFGLTVILIAAASTIGLTDTVPATARSFFVATAGLMLFSLGARYIFRDMAKKWRETKEQEGENGTGQIGP